MDYGEGKGIPTLIPVSNCRKQAGLPARMAAGMAQNPVGICGVFAINRPVREA